MRWYVQMGALIKGYLYRAYGGLTQGLDMTAVRVSADALAYRPVNLVEYIHGKRNDAPDA